MSLTDLKLTKSPAKKIFNRPKHVAIIMDGNGRWATKHNKPRVMGHRQGAQTVRMAIETCIQEGVSYLTLYAFSSENWKRPEAEVNFLMNLLSESIEKEIDALNSAGVRFLTIGNIGKLPRSVQDGIERMKSVTQSNSKLNLIIALNYGSRQEILDAMHRWVQSHPNKSVRESDVASLTEASFSQWLDTNGIPDPDLLIRTSGEMRLSNFLLWQCSYSEIYVSPKMWPEFTREDFVIALDEFAQRERRYGDIK